MGSNTSDPAEISQAVISIFRWVAGQSRYAGIRIIMLSTNSTTNKVAIFQQVFKGRTDIVPRYWKSKDGKRQGYSPLCRNEWKDGICQKPCRTCSNSNYIPFSYTLILDHLKGTHVLGVYPLLKDNTCHFTAADLDNHDNERNPLKDVRALCEVCQVNDTPLYVLRSKGGKGYHTYIFFVDPVPAWKARLVYFELLKEAQVIGDHIKLSSFDRLFPNQDELSGKGFGNLISLPFQGRAAKNGHTLFLDPASEFSEPYKNQWDVLANIERISSSTLDDLIAHWNLKQETSNGNGYNYSARTNDKAIEKILDCDFVKWCQEQPERVPEPLWYSLISNLICLRPGGYSLCHQISKGHPGYSVAETDSKIHQALDSSGPHRCEYIVKNGFKCKRDCGVKSPAALLFNNGDHEHEHKKERASVSFV
jgi:hypothetical protein